MVIFRIVDFRRHRRNRASMPFYMLSHVDESDINEIVAYLC